eukprot:gene8018-7846_t
MTCDTTNKEFEANFTYFCMEIEPKIKPYGFQLNKKLLDCPFTKQLDPAQYFPYLRSVENAAALYREQNVPLQAEVNLLAQQYGVISGAMSVEIDGKEYTLQQAAKFLQSPERSLRENVFNKVATRRLTNKDELNELFDKLLNLRQQIARNAGFDNYRDYKFRELGRFDYTPDDCFAFHQAAMNRLDLESRKGKAPGGYNCPLSETGVPFIFMNAAGTMGDVITMMHEGGHAVHSFLSHPLELSSFKEYPMEIAELASMSMELFTMEHWDVFFSDTKELKRAQLEEMERIISVLPWIATIDKYQHWLYTTPGHTVQQREEAWINILNEFSTGITDWSGFE